MHQAEPGGVQRLAGKGRQFRIRLAIDLVADQRMVDRSQVNADLVRTTSFQRTLDKSAVGKFFQELY